MADKTFLSWPFFTDRHRALAEAMDRWASANLPNDHSDIDAACRNLVARLGRDPAFDQSQRPRFVADLAGKK